MKSLIFSLTVLVLISCHSHSDEELLKKTHQSVQNEIAEHIETCGRDVVGTYDGTLTSKGCDYRIDPENDESVLTPQDMKTGYIHREDWAWQEGVEFASAPESVSVPETWDFLEFGAARDVPVKRQRCGDCWAQATMMNLMMLIAAYDNKQVDLSIQTLISSCCRHGSCGGGYMSTPDWIMQHGAPFEHQDPYQGRNSSCRFSQAQLSAGFEYKIKSAPYVGSSLQHSRYFKKHPELVDDGAKVQAIKRMMVHYKSPAVVTISAVSSSGGIVSSCAAINSGGNHMQNIVGWYPHSSHGTVAVVKNSWGTGHGQGGYTHIKWECGAGRLNRGLGRAARVYEYESECENQADAYTGGNQTFVKASLERGVWIGRVAKNGQKCDWTPKEGLSKISEDGCEAFASPDVTTEYHLTASTPECGERSAMALITPLTWARDGFKSSTGINTPHGMVIIEE